MESQRLRHRGAKIYLSFKGVHALTLMCQTLHVNIGVDHTALKQTAFGQNRAVFGNQVVSGKDQVLRGFAKARICVQIGAQQAAGLLPDKVAAVIRLAD